MIIPIGVDCGLADFCKKYNLRTMAFPFDWAVTYNGVSKCFEDDFKLFTEPLQNRINTYDVYFYHDFKHGESYQTDKEKYVRRYTRLMNLLETTTEELIFFRKGHAPHHHAEHNGKYTTITSDIEDAEKLHEILSIKYPNLKYTIIVLLICGKCFQADVTYTSTSDKIKVHNIAMPQVDDSIFEKCARSILNV